MKVSLLIVLLSMLCAFIFMPGGYGLWEKKLTIKGNITVVNPEPQVSDNIPGITERLENILEGSGTGISSGGGQEGVSNSEATSIEGLKNIGPSDSSSSEGSESTRDTGNTGSTESNSTDNWNNENN